MAIRVDVYPLVRSVCSGLKGVVPLPEALGLFFPLPFFFFLAFVTSASGVTERATEGQPSGENVRRASGFFFLASSRSRVCVFLPWTGPFPFCSTPVSSLSSSSGELWRPSEEEEESGLTGPPASPSC